MPVMDYAWLYLLPTSLLSAVVSTAAVLYI